jgi:DNA-binding transcriptional ArsR family regulator
MTSACTYDVGMHAFDILGDPVRRRILELLADGEQTAGAIMALDLFLCGEVIGDPVAAANSPQAQGFSKESAHAWAAVVENSGAVTAGQLAAATEVALAQFASDLAHSQDQQTSE